MGTKTEVNIIEAAAKIKILGKLATVPASPAPSEGSTLQPGQMLNLDQTLSLVSMDDVGGLR